MRNNKVTSFVQQVQDLLDSVERDEVKSLIGDSIDNNRTLTVSQFLRYLRLTRRISNLRIANAIETVYNSQEVSSYLSLNRFFTSRRDSYDVNEFINAVSMSNARSLSQVISKVA